MTLGELLPIPVVLPLTGGLLAPLAARLHRRLAPVIGIVGLLGALGILLAIGSQVYAGSGRTITHFLSGEQPVHGHSLGIALTADPFGLTFALLAAGVGSLLLVAALSELGDLGPRELGGLVALTQLLLAALIGAALTADTINLFVWFEVAALSSYGLTGFFLERPIALEAAFKNLVLTSIAGFAVFVGAGVLYADTGALNLGQLYLAAPSGRASVVAIALLVAGFATKAGLVPFHAWLPDAHTPVPGAVSALFSALMVNLGVLGLVRLGVMVLSDTRHLLGLLTLLGIASAVAGALLALVQDDLKRLLAWDTVSQTGVLVVGFASHHQPGVTGAVYHLVNHGLFKALLFLCAGGIVHATGLTNLSTMGGLARCRPVTAAAFVVGSVAIAGVPPLNGYASLGLIHEGLDDQPVILALAILAQIVTVAALSRAAWLAFFRRRPEPYDDLVPLGVGMRISLLTLAGACVAFGVLAGPVVRRIAAPAAALILHPTAYAHAALGSRVELPPLQVSFHYLDPVTLLSSLGELGGGLALAAIVLRSRTGPRPLGWLRRLHTGSVNDYAAFAVIGLLVGAVTLLA